MGFVLAISEAVQGKKSSSVKPNDNIVKVVSLLDTLDKWVNEIPPTEQPQRFGNKSFRIWFEKLKTVR